MIQAVSLHALARAELFEAAAFYALEAPGLKIAFVAEFERALRFIQQHPEAAPILRGTVRAKVLDRFPYTLLYRVRNEEIRILAMMHQKRRPFYWRGRS